MKNHLIKYVFVFCTLMLGSTLFAAGDPVACPGVNGKPSTGQKHNQGKQNNSRSAHHTSHHGKHHHKGRH